MANMERNDETATLLQQNDAARTAPENFQAFWQASAERRRTGNFAIPRMVVWLNGSPGAGKGTNAAHIRDILNIKAAPIITSDLLTSPEFSAIKDSGRLVGDGDVTKIVFSTLLEKTYSGGALVDGYPRTAVQAECIFLLHNKLSTMGRRSEFLAVTLEVSEKVSIERQLGRGKIAQEHNAQVKKTSIGTKMPLRRTDSDPAAARERYQIFVKENGAALSIFEKHFRCYRIDASGSFEQVLANIGKALKP
jgi:adenylate kinase